MAAIAILAMLLVCVLVLAAIGLGTRAGRLERELLLLRNALQFRQEQLQRLSARLRALEGQLQQAASAPSKPGNRLRLDQRGELHEE